MGEFYKKNSSTQNKVNYERNIICKLLFKFNWGIINKFYSIIKPIHFKPIELCMLICLRV